jgi:hypothetical protein
MFSLGEAYLSSGRTQKSFCAEHDLAVPVLAYWLAKYRRQSPSEQSRFIEITPPSPGYEPALFEISYPSGIRLRCFTLVPPAYLDHLLARGRA